MLERQPRLGIQPDRRVGRAEALVTAPLDDLQEEEILEARRVELEVLAVLIPVIENVVVP